MQCNAERYAYLSVSCYVIRVLCKVKTILNDERQVYFVNIFMIWDYAATLLHA